MTLCTFDITENEAGFALGEGKGLPVAFAADFNLGCNAIGLGQRFTGLAGVVVYVECQNARFREKSCKANGIIAFRTADIIDLLDVR